MWSDARSGQERIGYSGHWVGKSQASDALTNASDGARRYIRASGARLMLLEVFIIVSGAVITTGGLLLIPFDVSDSPVVSPDTSA